MRRLDNKWQGTGNSGARFLKAEHPYAVDLDIFGRASLFELLCTARTQAGEQFLADWLRAPAPPNVVRARQEAVEELRMRLDLREDLAILGEQTRGAIHPDTLAAWGKQPPIVFSALERTLTGAFVLAVLGGAGWYLTGRGAVPFLVLFAVERLFAQTLSGRIKSVAGTVEKPARDLGVFALLLARIEQESVQSPRLTQLHSLLLAQSPSDSPIKSASQDAASSQSALPSARIARLERLAELLEIPHNPLLKLLDAVLQFSTFCVFAIENWRQQNGPRIADWNRAVGEWEALSALSGYAYEHPGDPFPEIIGKEDIHSANGNTGDATAGAAKDIEVRENKNSDTRAQIVLEAHGLAHPLLPAETAIRNDLTFSDTQRLYVVSGSNMSGKSTLMRALGTNVVLGLAGAPVRAQFLRLTPLQIGASIRTQDSLEAGISRFYAEILRLRQIVDMATAPPPLLFLLDEILHGTNSHDRLVGAEAVIRALVAKNAIGLVTTHDLALARIANDANLRAANVHLEDQLQDGKMAFDYLLRPGVVEKSNAIELMRAVGLEV